MTLHAAAAQPASPPQSAEPMEAMDRMYRHQRYIYDLTRRYYLLGRDAMIDHLAVPDNGSVLELGCGTARNLLHTAARYPTARLYGFDVSAEMLKTAAASIAASRNGPRIAIAVGDATDFDPVAMFGVATFDRIYISYALSMIPAWHDVIERALPHLAPGGRLHIVDFGRMHGMPAPCRLMLRGWLTRFSVTPRHDLADAVRDLAETRGFSYRVTESPRGYWVEATIVRS